MTIDTIYMIHHTHTDIGFTNDQPIFWELQYRFIDDALRLVDQYKNNPSDSQFRWTVETTCGLEAWLKTASATEVDRLIAAENAGMIEIMAMQTNNTPLLNTIQLIESLRPIARMRKEYGFDIRFAMNCDINGQNWTLPDILLDAGIEGFSMTINHRFGGPPTPRPSIFHWQAPSGRTLPAFNGWQYSKLNDFGIGNESEDSFAEWLPKINAYLDSVGYPLTYLMLQGFHIYGDNGSAWGNFAEFANRWNQSGKTPRLVSATPRMFWERVKGDSARLQTSSGDWTDYWNFGCISAARETTINRTSRSRLFRSDALSSVLNLIGQNSQINLETSPTRWADRTNALYRDQAWLMLNLYGEHTWGADTASNEPQLEDSLSMDNHKKNIAYTARALSLMLERDALADFAHFIRRNDPTEMLVFNTLPWERMISGPLPKNLLIPRGLGSDTSSSRHYLGRMQQPTDFWTGRSEKEYNGGMGWLLKPVQVPAFGYKVVGWDDLSYMAEAVESDDSVVENSRYKITFDTQKGGITSLFDKQLNYEWIDSSAVAPLHGFIHEEVADFETSDPRKLLFSMDWKVTTETERGWLPDWKANRTAPSRLAMHKVYSLPSATVVEQILEHDKIGEIMQRTYIPTVGDQIEFQSEWKMGTTIHPEATYLLFPFNLPNTQARFDIGGVPVRTHMDQLAGSCRDYFTVQGWVDFNNGQHGVTIATPENPMVQLGDFHFGHNQSETNQERAMLLGWVTNNYWETNFPGAQPGTVTARYAILPYCGEFNESRAHQFAAEAEHARPILQHMGEAPADGLLPPSGTLLNLPQLPIETMSMRRAHDHEVLVTLLNSSDNTITTVLASGLLKFNSAWKCDLFGNRLDRLQVVDGKIEVTVAARRIITLLLEA